MGAVARRARYAPNVSAVTAHSRPGPAAMIDDNGGSQTAKDILVRRSRSIAYVGNRNTNGEGRARPDIGPQHARLMATAATASAEVKQFLWEHARDALHATSRAAISSIQRAKHEALRRCGLDPRVPIADSPEDIVIVVMGGAVMYSPSIKTRLASENVTVPIMPRIGPLLEARRVTGYNPVHPSRGVFACASPSG